MNNRFVKNNLVLILVISLSSVAAIALLVFALVEYVRMSAAISETNSLRTKIGELIKKSPAPVAGNRKPIMDDTAVFAAASRDFRSKFVRPMDQAVEDFIATLYRREIDKAVNSPSDEAKAFAESIREKAEADGRKLSDSDLKKAVREAKQQEFRRKFLADFHEIWDPIAVDNFSEKGLKLRLFKKRFPDWDRALAAFKASAEKVTTEEITNDNIEEILLDAMGIPRLFSYDSDVLKRFMTTYRNRIQQVILKDMKINEEPPRVSGGGGNRTEELTFGFNVDTPAYARDDYPIIAHHWDNIGDILKRIAAAGVPEFNGLVVRKGAGAGAGGDMGLMGNPMGGAAAGAAPQYASSVETAGSFEIYHYTFKVTAPLPVVRKLVKVFDDAYIDHRFYLVSSVYLYAPDSIALQEFIPDEDEDPAARSETASVTEETRRPTTSRRRRRGQAADPGMTPGMGMGEPGMEGGTAAGESEAELRRKRALEAAEREKKRQENLPFNQRDGYGAPVAAGSADCQAVIDVDYVVLKGN